MQDNSNHKFPFLVELKKGTIPSTILNDRKWKIIFEKKNGNIIYNIAIDEKEQAELSENANVVGIVLDIGLIPASDSL
jgi:hypothetical protein